MHLQGFTIDLDDPANIAWEISRIIEAVQQRAVESSPEYAGEIIAELEAKVAKMHNVSADELRTHRATLQKIAADLCDLNLGDDHG